MNSTIIENKYVSRNKNISMSFNNTEISRKEKRKEIVFKLTKGAGKMPQDTSTGCSSQGQGSIHSPHMAAHNHV